MVVEFGVGILGVLRCVYTRGFSVRVEQGEGGGRKGFVCWLWGVRDRIGVGW